MSVSLRKKVLLTKVPETYDRFAAREWRVRQVRWTAQWNYRHDMEYLVKYGEYRRGATQHFLTAFIAYHI